MIVENEQEIKSLRGGMKCFMQVDFDHLLRKLLSRDEFIQALRGILTLVINYGVGRGMRMGRTEPQFQKALRRVSNFVPGAKTELDKAIAAFPSMDFPFLWKFYSRP
ncbi:hypothetical protein Tco_0521833 [Tanacetum coccineum]